MKKVSGYQVWVNGVSYYGASARKAFANACKYNINIGGEFRQAFNKAWHVMKDNPERQTYSAWGVQPVKIERLFG
jgi:hypothetical protein